MSSSDKQATDNTDAKTNSPAAESASSEETAAGNDVELKIERLAGVLEEKCAAPSALFTSTGCPLVHTPSTLL